MLGRERRAAWLAAGMLVLSLMTACAPPSPAPSEADIAARLGAAAPLLPLFRALSLHEAHPGSAPLTILQIGDSHTANDAFSGRMRELFQARFGDAGRGILPPGIPFRYYRPARVSVTAQGWSVQSSFRPDASGAFGVSGLREHADRAAVMTLTAPAPGELDHVEIEVLRQPGGGTIDAALDTGASTAIATSAAAVQAAFVAIPSSPAAHTLTVQARGDGPVDLLSWTVTRGSPGMLYANLGTIGATVDLIDRWDPAILHQELAHLAPAMIVLAFGTNEGFRDSTDLAAYAATFAARLRALHEDAPGAALLVLGPPDGARHLRKGAAGQASCGDPNWTEPPRLPAVREIQRSVARQQNAYFWDWQAAMGGACSMLRWAAADPPFAAPDHVHLFTPGYRATAETLFQTLMDGYAHYLALGPRS